MAKYDMGYAVKQVSKERDIALCKWYDKHTELMFFNFLSIDGFNAVKRWNPVEKGFVDVSTPEIIKDYYYLMGEVDLFN